MTRRLPFIRLAALALALSVASHAAAQDRVPADPATTGQKAEFVGNLVSDSVSARRIEQSGDAAAIQALETARGLVTAAKADLTKGAVQDADDKLDRALELVNVETKRLSGDEVTAAHDRDIYERRLKSVKTFLSAYERVSDSDSGAASQAKAISGLIGRAEGEAAKGSYDKAIAHLDDAYGVARGDIRAMRQGQTLTRSLDFATAAEEYEYERGRNQSHFMLLQFALTEHSPQGSVVGAIEKNRKEAEARTAAAEKSAAGGDYPTAIGELNTSTDLLLKSIRMSGLFIP